MMNFVSETSRAKVTSFVNGLPSWLFSLMAILFIMAAFLTNGYLKGVFGIFGMIAAFMALNRSIKKSVKDQRGGKM
jgi:hypothetical protein